MMAGFKMPSLGGKAQLSASFGLAKQSGTRRNPF